MIQAMRAGEELCTVLGEDALASECRMVASKAIKFSLRKKSRFPSEKDRITPGDKQAAALMLRRRTSVAWRWTGRKASLRFTGIICYGRWRWLVITKVR